MGKERDKKIDILRAVALVMILLAHSDPPAMIAQLRNFDVVLMVSVMGLSFYVSQNGKPVSYRAYAWKRFKRLILPTWKFLLLFAGLFYLLPTLLTGNASFSGRDIGLSFLLLHGLKMDYVWIMRLFFEIALISPLFLALSRKIRSNRSYVLFLAGGYLVYTGFLFLGNFLPAGLYLLYNNLVLQTMGFGLVFALGLRLKQFAKIELYFLTAGLSGILLFLALQNEFAPTQIAKYPPTLYYLAYGLLVSLLLYRLLDFKKPLQLLDGKAAGFLSRNSDLLYFWHILPASFIEGYASRFAVIADHYLVRFVILLGFSVAGTLLQNQLKTKLRENRRKAASAEAEY